MQLTSEDRRLDVSAILNCEVLLASKFGSRKTGLDFLNAQSLEKGLTGPFMVQELKAGCS